MPKLVACFYGTHSPSSTAPAADSSALSSRFRSHSRSSSRPPDPRRQRRHSLVDVSFSIRRTTRLLILHAVPSTNSRSRRDARRRWRARRSCKSCSFRLFLYHRLCHPQAGALRSPHHQSDEDVQDPWSSCSVRPSPSPISIPFLTFIFHSIVDEEKYQGSKSIYNRNAFIFNVCFVFERDAELSVYEPVVRKTGRTLRAMEESSSLLSNPPPGFSMENLLEQLYLDLNAYCETSIPLVDIDLDLGLFPFYANPPEVNIWDVPIAVAPLESMKSYTWDITLYNVRPFSPFVASGTNRVFFADLHLHRRRQPRQADSGTRSGRPLPRPTMHSASRVRFPAFESFSS